MVYATVCDCVCISTCGKLIAVSVFCSPEELLSFSATRATSTPLLNTSCPLTLKHKIAIAFSGSFSLLARFNCML